MKIVTVQEMRDIERAADAAGLSYGQMMENAGQAIAQAVLDAVRSRIGDRPARVLVLVGPGNNGGDGLIAARHLCSWGHAVRLVLWRRALESDPLLDAVRELGLLLDAYDEGCDPDPLRRAVRESDIVVDALLGTGVTGTLRGGAETLLQAVAWEIESINDAQERRPLVPVGGIPAQTTRPQAPLVVAVDVPSGLNSDTGAVDERTLAADLTVTMAFPKLGHFAFPGAAYVGALLVADIGIEPSLARDVGVSLATPEMAGALLPARPLDAHKGAFGKVLVVAGSVNYVGAPVLAAIGAYRAGAGLVTLAVPEAIHGALAASQAEATYLLLPHDMGVLAPPAVQVVAQVMGQYQVLLLGPGLGQEDKTGAFVEALLGSARPGQRPQLGLIPHRVQGHVALELPPMVIDADGLNLLARVEGWPQRLPRDTVLTPHPGEMSRLLGSDTDQVNANRIATASRSAQAWGCTVVLKGAYTVIASPETDTVVLPFATPALATAGSGDVLAGVIAGMMAQGLSGPQAAVCGAYLHGLAGALWQRDHGDAGLLASDLGMYLVQARQALR